MHSDDPAGVPPENEKQPEPDQQSSTASPNPSPASKEPERAHQGSTRSKSATPSSARPGPAAVLKKIVREDSRLVDRVIKEMERRKVNDIMLQERLHAQLSSEAAHTAPRKTKPKKKGKHKATTEKLIFSASDDYRNIAFRGEKHFLTKNQATIVRLLHEAYKRGQPMVPEDRLLFAIDSQTELQSYFRGSALWGSLVIKGPRKGTFQLSLTPVSPGSKPQSSR